MKEYKTNEELLDYIKQKGIRITNNKKTLLLLKNYSYYSIINTYKDVFKDSNGNYKDNVAFNEIYSLYDFDKNIY